MKKILTILFVLILLCVMAAAQEAPFGSFKKAVDKESGGFSGNKQNLARVFNAERIRLAGDFEAELWKYIENDADRAYWLAYFVTSSSYLHRNAALPKLAFSLRQKAVELLKDKSDKRSLGRKVTMLRDLALAAREFGEQNAAVKYRDMADDIVARHDGLDAYISPLDKYELCIYKQLTVANPGCTKNTAPKEKIVSAGILNGKTTNSVRVSGYPEAARKARVFGQVIIQILIDFDGNVIDAQPVKGRHELFEVCVEAALKTKFRPTLLSGEPVKVSGVLVYDFQPPSDGR